jgi:hypothetical protein
MRMASPQGVEKNQIARQKGRSINGL